MHSTCSLKYSWCAVGYRPLQSKNLTVISQINGQEILRTTSVKTIWQSYEFLAFWILLGLRLRGKGAWSSGCACWTWCGCYQCLLLRPQDYKLALLQAWEPRTSGHQDIEKKSKNLILLSWPWVRCSLDSLAASWSTPCTLKTRKNEKTRLHGILWNSSQKFQTKLTQLPTCCHSCWS